MSLIALQPPPDALRYLAADEGLVVVGDQFGFAEGRV